jgi:uncharacterized membrane protein YkvI
MLLGAATGGTFLGAGGRLVMRLFALATARPPGFGLRGTLNVILAGAIAGMVGALLLIAVRRFLPARLWPRALVFAVLCYTLAIPGFRPPVALVFVLFAPVFLAYGITLVFLERHFRTAAV